MKFVVYENEVKAQYPDSQVHKSWNCCVFDTFEEAEDYAIKWLNEFAPPKGILKLNEPYEFYTNCIITIKGE